MHRDAVQRIDPNSAPRQLCEEAWSVWRDAVHQGELDGYRNAQASVLAPTGTIGFMMDCDTTGVEPDLALVKYKKLVGGGTIRIVNNTVPLALEKLGYEAPEIQDTVDYINDKGTIEGAPHLKPEHLAVFDCAFRPVNGTRSIPYMGHLKMMGAVQPFHLWGDLEDGEPSSRGVGRRDHASLYRSLAPWSQGCCDLPGWIEADAAAQHERVGNSAPRGDRVPAGAPAFAVRKATRSPTNSASPGTKGT